MAGSRSINYFLCSHHEFVTRTRVIDVRVQLGEKGQICLLFFEGKIGKWQRLVLNGFFLSLFFGDPSTVLTFRISVKARVVFSCPFFGDPSTFRQIIQIQSNLQKSIALEMQTSCSYVKNKMSVPFF